MIRKPSRAEMAAEYHAKQQAQRDVRRKEAERTRPFRSGDLQTVFGRLVQPGEVPSAAPPSAPRWPWENDR